MKFSQAFKLALKSLSGSKMRAFLTMLGIIIGVGSVIILLSSMGGFQSSLTDTFESMGTSNLTVTITGRAGDVKIDPEEFTQYAFDNSEFFNYASPTVNAGSMTVRKGTTETTSSVTGGNEYYQNIKDYHLSAGRFISYSDLMQKNYICVIGSYNANELFGDAQSAIGQEIKLNGTRFIVEGVIEAKEDSSENSSDNFVVIPYTTAQRLVKSQNVNSYTFVAKSTDIAPLAKTNIETYLFKIFNDSDYYRVTSLAEILDQVDTVMNQLSLVLVGIAAISLLVGGIGIMNIMLVSVTERTKEIGIRKSLGGKRRDIMTQFVIEAGTTSALGGVLGIGFGILTANLLAPLLQVKAVTSPFSIILAFSVSVGIGIIFGYFPASKAAKLNPIDALRFD